MITSGTILIIFFVSGGYRPQMKTRSNERTARRLYRRHTKYKGARRQALPRPRQLPTPRTRKKYDGWGSPLPPPHLKPSSAPTTSEILSHFLDSHDPSQIVHYLFDDVIKNVSKEKRERVSVNLRSALISSLEYPTCFSSSSVEQEIVINTGASVWISPHKEDFTTYVSSNMKIKDLSSTNTVAGEGIIRWDLQDEKGYTVTIEGLGYHIPAAKVRLLSPQVLIKKDGGHATISPEGICIRLANNITLFGRYCGRSNLPLIPMANTKKQRFSFWNEAFSLNVNEPSMLRNILGDNNTNLSASQKEVLLWHQRLSHASIRWIQMLMRKRDWLQSDDGKPLHNGPFITTKSSAPTCDISRLKCGACLCAKATVKRPQHMSPRPSPARGYLKQNDVHPGSCISADHYFSPVPGRLLHTFGRERHGYTCGSLFVDHASGKIFNFPQFSTNATETLKSVARLESHARDAGFKIKRYHSDNGIFSKAEFTAHCDRNDQKYDFSGVGAHFQNGVAERNIKTVAEWARANMLHLATHWPQQANLSFWPQAIDYSTWVFNRLPNVDTGITPNEIWSSVRNSGHELARAHVFGCPVYVLDPALQDGKKIPKWNPRARLGLFLGFSEGHSSQVPLVLNVTTGKIIFDDKFDTVHSITKDESVEQQWRTVLQLGYECFIDTDFDENGNQILPKYGDLIKNYIELKSKRALTEPIGIERGPAFDLDNHQDNQHNDPLSLPPHFDQQENPLLLPPNPLLHPPQDDQQENPLLIPPPRAPTVHTDTFQGNHLPGGDNPNTVVGDGGGGGGGGTEVETRPRRNVGTYKDGPAKIRRLPIDGEEYEFGFNVNVISDWEQPVLAVSNSRHVPTSFHAQHKLQKGYLAECYLLQNSWFEDPTCVSELSDHIRMDPWEDGKDIYFNEIEDPRILEARKSKSSKYDADNPSYDTATRGPFQAEFWQAMRLEFNTLLNEFDCWDYVPNPGKNVLRSTWAFKIKRYPDGRVKKFKARFCARGDMQKEGIDYFETWAPVVMWSTVRIVMVLAAKLDLVSVQCDITAAFIHGKVPITEEIYVHQPRGFHRGRGDEVLRLKRTLYGLKQSSRYFFEYISERLIKLGLSPSKYDPSLFMNDKMIVIIYVDDILIYGRRGEESQIDELIEALKKEEVALHKEGTAEGYLGVDIQRDGNRITLQQRGLTQRIIEALGLDSKYSTSCHTPAETAALGKDVDGENASGHINYPSVIGMLLYLEHSRPDISFATHQCARYTHSPKLSHENALK